MIRLLIIGRPAEDWAERLRRVAGDDLEIDTARLPSAGIRQFETTPADLIIIADDRGGSRVETLAAAIRKRPLGQLVPVLFLCPPPEDGPVDKRVEALELVGWLPPEASPQSVLTEIESALDTDLRGTPESVAGTKGQTDDRTENPDATDDEGAASYFDGDVVLEPIDEPAKPRRVGRSTIFGPSSNVQTPDNAVGSEAIERKLKAVRHEDYYSILEVRRGAESQTVREAFHGLYARFDPDSLPFDLVRRYQDEIDEIRDALEDAFAVLGDPDLREPYLQYTVKH